MTEERPSEPAADQPPSTGRDRNGLVAFLGVLALALLLVGAVAAAGSTNGWGSGGRDAADAAPGSGRAFGQQKKLEQQERRLERMAERAQRQAERLERQRQQRELREQQRQARGMNPDEAAMLTEQTGTVSAQAEVDGTTTYLLETAAGSFVLEVGPPSFWGEAHPLAPYVGQAVTVTGVAEAETDEFEVFAIGDQVIRGPGRPPWAGGWKAGMQRGPNVAPAPTTAPHPSPTTAPHPSPTTAP